MPTPLIIVNKRSDFRWPDPDGRAVTLDEYLADPAAHPPSRRKTINLCRDCDYLGAGYYASLLAEARGDRVTPSVEALLDLRRSPWYMAKLTALGRLLDGLSGLPDSVHAVNLHVYFGRIADPALAEFAAQCFETFRCPLLAVDAERAEVGWRVTSVETLDPRQVDKGGDALFLDALDRYARRQWRPRLAGRTNRLDLAVLHDPNDPLPPSKLSTLKHLAGVAEEMGVGVELIERKDFARLTQFDALLIRETTAVPHHTYRFARKAEAAGMPVIDDPTSILRCTNKAYLAELLRHHGVATPATRLATRKSLIGAAGEMAFPLVLKIPDGSFSRGVRKVGDAEALQQVASAMFKDSEIILLQEFLYTPYDWRVGLLDGHVLFVARYHMCDQHWQIIRHDGAGQHDEGRTEAIDPRKTPPAVIETALAAANLIGRGFYGVDLKETPAGVYVIEVNDNPNLDRGLEDAIAGDEVYRQLIRRFLSLSEGNTVGRAA